MPKTIEEAFGVFHTRLTPYTTETEAVKKHRVSIKTCLENNFGMTDFVRTGSTGNGTGISGFSDTDYFAVIPSDKLKTNSATSLAEIRAALETRFPKTGIYVDSPAVACPFGSGGAENTEIVPADYVRTSNGYKIYEIPDRSGGWMNASPLAHNTYVSTINDKLGKKVKPLIRFLKAWKYFNNVPISSFYLEIRVAKYAAGESSIIYAIDIKNILRHLADNDLPAVIDPTGISGYIHPCSTDAKKVDALSKLKTALSRAEKANEAESNKKITDAFDWWNLLYNYNFPKYS
jgi:hypothetical protein